MAADHPPIIRVKRREELVAALKLRTAPIVIEDEELARPFVQYARTQYCRSRSNFRCRAESPRPERPLHR
jgi:hypothetical protein